MMFLPQKTGLGALILRCFVKRLFLLIVYIAAAFI